MGDDKCPLSALNESVGSIIRPMVFLAWPHEVGAQAPRPRDRDVGPCPRRIAADEAFWSMNSPT
jgi:hypothetical protein